MILRSIFQSGAGTIQNKAFVEIRGLCCFWGLLNQHSMPRALPTIHMQDFPGDKVGAI